MSGNLFLLFEKRKRLLSFLGGILIIFFTWSFILPKVSQTLEARQALVQKKNRLEKMRAKVSDLEGLNEFELSQRTELVLKAIPGGKNFIEVLGILNKVANDKGLVVESFQVSPGEISATTLPSGAEIGKLVFKISLVGNVEGIEAFLSTIEKTLPLITPAGELDIDLEEKPPKAEVDLESYFLPLPTTLGPVEKPVSKLTPDEEKVFALLSGFISFPETVIPPPTGKANPFAF